MCDIRNDGIKKFQGVNIENIQKCFQVNIDVFEIDACENTSIVYKSPCFYDNQMFLNLFGNHVSYITNINRYAKKYVCSICKKHFSTAKKLTRHSKCCSDKTKHIFPGGFYEMKKTIFDELKEIDIIVNEQDKLFPWFIVFYFEAVLEDLDSNMTTTKLKLERIHRTISVSICSNVPEFIEEHFILEEDVEILLQNMIFYMENISKKVFELGKQKWSSVFQKLDLLTFWKPRENSGNENIDKSSDTDAMENSEFEPPSKQFLKKIAKEKCLF